MHLPVLKPSLSGPALTKGNEHRPSALHALVDSLSAGKGEGSLGPPRKS